ncbi:unnamed protein product [Moneuplotes crassus]|uniref:DUS-like FMN-binding domain-containing protein n=1 Tax=Euplotes crassus TaxID=5936 RepID=A0AAD1UJR9_EUPCR|nr:unnamed protein product [Moneuplotes crassus]
MESTQEIPKLCLAPMVRVCTHPFRLLALRHGADFIYTEEIIDKKLIDVERIVNEDLKTIDYVSNKDKSVVLRISEEEKPKLVCQLGTNNPETVVKAAKIIQNDVHSIDINMGCPEFFSIHAGMGAGLVKLPEKARSILQALTENIDIPISCKIRILPEATDTFEFIKTMQSTGIEHLSIHSRIREELSKGFAHWSIIREVIQNKDITIPIRANGDCFSCNDAVEIKRYTSCDGILIARGACHNPAIFNDIKDHWTTVSHEETKEEPAEDPYQEHKKPLHECGLDKLVEEETKLEEFKPEVKEGMSKNQAKKRAKKMLKKSKKDNSAQNGTDGKQSKTLARIIETRNHGCNKVEILSLCQEYLKIAIEYGNRFGNTKYTLNYMLRTHKKEEEAFQRVNSARNMKEMAKALSVDEFYTEQVAERPVLISYFTDTFYKKKNKLKRQKIEEEE